LSSLVRDKVAQRYGLTPLSAEDTARMVRAMLGGLVEEALVSHVVERSRGNPWITGEVLRDLLETKHLKRKRGYWEWDHEEVSLPPTLQEAFEERFQRLEESARELAAIAAVIGDEVAFDPLLELSGWEEDNALDSLEELLRAGIAVEERRGRDEVYRFAHPLLREVAVAQLSQRKKRRLHARYAKMLEESGAEPELLALHWGEAEDSERAAPYALEAVRKAERVYALAPIEPHVRHVLLRLEPEHPLYAQFQLYLGKIMTLTGRSDEAEQLLRELLDTTSGELQAQVRLALAHLFQRQGKWRDAIQLIEADLSSESPPEAWRLLIICLRFSERYEEALARIEQAKAVLPPEPFWQAHLIYQEGATLAAMRRYEEARQKLVTALEMVEETGHLALTVNILNEMGRVLRAQSRFEDAVTYFKKASELAARLSDWRGLAALEINIGIILSKLEGEEAALTRFKKALLAGQRGGYRDLEAVVLNNMAYSLTVLGRFKEAMQYGNNAAKLHEELAKEEWLLSTLLDLARAEMLAGIDPEPTLNRAELVSTRPHFASRLALRRAWSCLLEGKSVEAISFLQQAREQMPEDVEVALTLVEALIAAEKLEEAREVFEQTPPSEDWQSVRSYLEARLQGKLEGIDVWLHNAENQGKWEWAKSMRRASPS
jgi:tetratricopeptide (TPR) repeat protein